MSKSKKEPYIDDNDSSFLRRTIVNAPSSSNRKSEDNDRRSQTSHSRSSDSSSEPKKYRKPVARGSESGIIFDTKKLKKYSITIKNKLAPVKPPILHINNPETITPVRRPEYSSDESEDYDHMEKYVRKRKNEANVRKYEGRLPIFEKKERPLSSDERKSSSHDVRLESSRRKYRSRSREDSPEYRIQRPRSNHSGSRSHKHRRARSPSSRRSSSSESSSSSSDDRKKRKKYCSSRSSKKREERLRRESKMERAMIEREMQRRERRLQEEREREMHHRERRHLDDRELPYREKRHDEFRRHYEPKPYSYSNGDNPPSRLKERPRESPPESVDRSNQELVESDAPSHSHEMMRPRFPVRMMPPPYMMRVPMRPFVPPPAPFPPAYPPPVRFYPHPPLPFRPMLRPPRPPRGFFRPPP